MASLWPEPSSALGAYSRNTNLRECSQRELVSARDRCFWNVVKVLNSRQHEAESIQQNIHLRLGLPIDSFPNAVAVKVFQDWTRFLRFGCTTVSKHARH